MTVRSLIISHELSNRDFDVLVAGRAGVDLLSNDNTESHLLNAQTFTKYVGGSPANVAIGLARLGVKTSIVARVGADQFGYFVKRELNRERVDTSNLVFDSAHLTPIAISTTDVSETPETIFLRENCADLYFNITDVASIDCSRYRAVIIMGSSLCTATQREAIFELVRGSERASVPIVLDIDYRPSYWGVVRPWQGADRSTPSPHATIRLREILPYCSLVVGSEMELRVADDCNLAPDTIQSLRCLTDAIIVEHSAAGCTIYSQDAPIFAPGYRVDVVSPLGAGDAFLAGFLKGVLAGESLLRSAELANANGAIVTSSKACSAAMATPEELNIFLATSVRAGTNR